MRFLLLMCLLSAFFAGCTARGYSGPARPADEISTVTLNKVGDLTFEHMVFDGRGISNLSDNVELLPGDHELRIYFQTEERRDCYPGQLFCAATEIEGVCEGRIRTLAGRTYLVTVENKYSLIDMRMAAKGYFDLSERTDEPAPGEGSCRTLSSRDIFY